MIDLDRWNEIKETVQTALDLPAEERAAYLDEACGQDRELRRQVDALLAVSSSRADFFDDYRLVPDMLREVSLAEGTQLGDYRIIRELGRGGMGAVYLAEDGKHDRQVAIKILPPRAERVSRDEQRNLARVQHPGIATLYDSGRTPEGFPFIVMEYIDGKPITDFCDDEGLSVEKRLALFIKVCEAVAVAHQNLVVHRDIKPSNILVTKDGEPKLVDFGISKRLSPDASDLTLTLGSRPLTIAFASPEQLAGEAVTTGTDVYSLGVLLFLLLTGRLPYAIKNAHELAMAIRVAEPRRPSQLVKEPSTRLADERSLPISESEAQKLERKLRGDLDAIALKALRKETERRYATVAEFASDVRCYLTKEPVSARRGSRRYRAGKFIRRYTLGVTLTAGALVALIVVALWLTSLYREAAHQRAEAQKAAENAEGVADFLANLFNISDPWDRSERPASVSDLLDQAYQRSTEDLANSPAVRARIQTTLGDIFTNFRDFPRAERMLTFALKEPPEQINPLSRGNTWYILGALRYHQGNYPAAIAAHRTALRIQRNIIPLPHLDIGDTLTGLAQAQEEHGDLDAARQSFIQALREEALAPRPKGDISRANTLSGFAQLELKASNFPAAEARTREALALLVKLFPPENPRIAVATNTLAHILEKQERFPESLATYEKALRIQAKALGANHPETLKVRSNIAETLRRQGNLVEAKRIQEEVLAIRRWILPPGHPSTAISISNLAGILLDTGPLSEAERLVREAMAMDLQAFGDSHPYIAGSYSKLGTIRLFEERFAEADRYFSDALDMIARTSGKNDRTYVTNLANRAQVLVKMGRLEEAESVVNEALAATKKLLGPNHVRLAILRGTIAKIRLKQGRIAEAEELARTAVKKTTEDLGTESSSTIRAQMLLADVLLSSGRAPEAEPLIRGALAYWTERAGTDGIPTRECEKLLRRLTSSTAR